MGATGRLRAALVTPLTGPLAGYGAAGARALRMWADDAGVELAVHDAHPDPAGALSAAGHADVLFGPYGSGPARALAAATDRVWWNHGGARVGRATQLNLLAPATSYWAGALAAIRTAAPDAGTVAVLGTGSGFGAAVADGAVAAAEGHGFPVTRGGLPLADVPDADVVLVSGDFESERAAADRLLPGRWRAVGFVGAGVDEVLVALGPRREGLLGPAQWLAAAAPEPDVGPRAADFVARWATDIGSDPPYPAVQAYAAGLLAAHCIATTGSTADADVRAAAYALDGTTLFGRFRLDPRTGEQVGHRPVTVQWQDGRRVAVWPPDVAQAPLRLGGD